MASNDAKVALPKKDHSRPLDAAPLWALNKPAAGPQARQPSPTPSMRTNQLNSLLQNELPLASKCAARGGQCCRDLKGTDERTLLDPDVVRDIVIGLSDGLTVPFALTAGLSSIGDTRLVVLGGLAELCAGAISMGLGGFLASKAELDHYHYLLKQTHDRVMRSCAGEMEREVHAVLGPLGVHENISRLLADNLRNVESGEDSDSGYGQSTEGVERPQERPARSNSPPAQAPSGGGILSGLLGGNKKADAEEGGLKWSDSVGLTAFLLKFGEGLEEVLVSRLWISAFTIGMSYFVGGLIPLLPYLFVKTSTEGLIVSTAVTAVILVIFGIFKTHFTGATGGLGGYAWGAFSTMAVGLLAAGAAFLLVRLLEVHE